MDLAATYLNGLPSLDIRQWSSAEWSIFLPMLVYWASSLLYDAFDYFKLCQHYKLLQDDEYNKNKATKWQVISGTLFNHGMIATIGFIGLALEPSVEDEPLSDVFGLTQKVLLQIDKLNGGHKLQGLAGPLYLLLLGARFFAAMFVLDTWQWWIHYGLHTNWLYRHIHITHHLLYAPYAYGAMYVHPVESLLLDACGPWLTYTLVGLTLKERMVFFCYSALKTVDDHSGYHFPWDPVIWLAKFTGSGMVYHTIHHQHWGIKYNYGLFSSFWDHVMNTFYWGPKTLNVQPQHLGLQPAEGFETKLDGKLKHGHVSKMLNPLPPSDITEMMQGISSGIDTAFAPLVAAQA